MKILVADDDKEIVELLSIYIHNEGYEVVKAYDGKEALSKLHTTPDIDLLILDIMMPIMDGMEVVKELRKESQIPIIMLTAKTTDMDKIKGLVAGADDYVTKPFNPLEVMARVKSILRRSQMQLTKEEPDELEVGPLMINKDSHEVKTIEGKEIQLTALEFGILYLLASHPNRVFSADEIFERVWQQESIVSAKTVMVHVSHLRDKIEEATGGEKSFKQCGELDIRSMLVKPKKIEKQKRITLTSKEISELLAEAIVTIVLLLLLNVSIMFLLGQLLSENSPLAGVIWATKDAVAKELNTDLFWSWNKFVLPIFFLVDAAVLYWRLIRRYHQMQLRHIISELHYIADGNYNHRIPFELSGDLAKVVTSINGLVDSTVAAIEDERRIEKSKDELITNVSHDIRTPLTSIIGYLGLIEDRQFHSQEDLLKYTHTAYVKAKQMKLLVDDLLNIQKSVNQVYRFIRRLLIWHN